MRLTVNGEKRDFPGATTLGDVLKALNLTTGRLACELNMNIVRRADYDKTALREDDHLEIVQMIGGG